MLGERFGAYVLRRKIGEGGMGAVYAAEHELLARTAAVKVLLPEFATKPTMRQRFINEARAAAAVKHPGIVEIYDIGYADDGRAFIAMELLEGETLGQRLARGPLERVTVYAIARQIASALGAAHKKAVVHRDLKPDNVFLVRDPDGPDRVRVKLLDFGVAKLLQPALDAMVTKTGAIVGTPTYMAPEQCRGVAVDHRADLYALGCMVFTMIARRPPFKGEGMGDILTAHVHLPAPRLSAMAEHVPAELDALIDRLLAKAPADRPQAAAELVPIFARLEREARVSDATAPSLPVLNPPPPLPRKAAPPREASPPASPSRPPPSPGADARAAVPTPPASAAPSTPPTPAAPAAPPPAAVVAPPRVAAAPVTPLAGDATQPTQRVEIPDSTPTLPSPVVARLVALAGAREPRPTDDDDDDRVTAPRRRLSVEEAKELLAAGAATRRPSPEPAASPASDEGPPAASDERRRNPSPTTLGGAATTGEPLATSTRASRTRRGPLVVALGAAVAVVAIALWRYHGTDTPRQARATTIMDAGLVDAPMLAQPGAVEPSLDAAPPLDTAVATGSAADISTDPVAEADALIDGYVTSIPAGARLFIGRTPIGRTPYRGKVAPGARLYLYRDGYRATSMVVSGDRFDWHPRLVRESTPVDAGLPDAAPLDPLEGLSAHDLLEDAMGSVVNEQWARALALAERALRAVPDPGQQVKAHAVATLAACQLEQAVSAKQHSAHLPPGKLEQVRRQCLRFGIEIEVPEPEPAPTAPAPSGDAEPSRSPRAGEGLTPPAP